MIRTAILIEDNPGDARLLREMVHEEEDPHPIDLTHVESMGEAESFLSRQTPDIILLDLGLPDVNGLDAVRRARSAASSRIPLVVLTGLNDEALAAQALQAGAQDYLIKGQIETRGLLRAMRYAVERNIMNEALFTEKERAQVTFNSIGDGVACMDIEGRITFLNGIAEWLTGWSGPTATGRPMHEVLRIIDASRSTEASPPEVQAGTNQPLQLPANCLLIRHGGILIPIEHCVSPIHDREGKFAGTVIVFRDVSAARAMSHQITHSAEHDFLTGLPNRMLLNDRVGQAIALAQRHQKHVAVLFLDLDGFKHVNDSLGHPTGDKLLKSIALRLLSCVRASDTVSRLGGDEFVVLLPEIERSEDAALTARRILATIAEAHNIEQQVLHITTSIGVSVYPDDGLDAETLIRNADTAMHQAKEGGRRNSRLFKPEMNVQAVERQTIEASLRRALKEHEFELHYQPKVDLRTGQITGAEALIRWQHSIRGEIRPEQFIPVAEDSGLIIPIGAWVLLEACRQARAWADDGLPGLTIAVNVSAIEFRKEGYLDSVCAVLDKTGLDPTSLELELTETVLINGAEHTASILQALRELGVSIALDDFGTGYSSLSYLLKFPVDVLKIDQSFVRSIGTASDGDTPLVIAVIAMARSLKLRVIAEGVETLQELEFLRNHGCDEAQGYYLGRPMPAQSFARLFSASIREPPVLSLSPEAVAYS